MKRLTYNINVKGQAVEVEGYQSETPGLAINNMQLGWIVVHLDSGLHLGPFMATRRQAVALTEVLLDATDWTMPMADVANDWTRALVADAVRMVREQVA